MKSLSAAILLAALCAYFNPVASDENYNSCRKFLAGFMKHQLETFTVCLNGMTFSSRKERSNKLHCIFKCLAIKESLLSPDGLVEKSTLENFVNTRLPEHLRSRAYDAIQTCSDIGYSQVDPKDEYCKSYAPLIKCAMDAINKFCDHLKPEEAAVVKA